MLLVTALKQVHNWIQKNDRNKMAFWYDALFDEDEGVSSPSVFRPQLARNDILHWLERNSNVCEEAKHLLQEYAKTHADKAPGIPEHITPLSANWVPGSKGRIDDPKKTERTLPVWNEDETDKFEQARLWGRVSHEIDRWWDRAKDCNIERWHAPMPSKEYARARHESFASDIMQRYAPSYQAVDGSNETSPERRPSNQEDLRSQSLMLDYIDEDVFEDDDVDDNESYGEGPLNGLLTELPNILDPEQIDGLHMIIKSCIHPSMGSGPNRFGENLQDTRCMMLLLMEGGRSLLREILVYIAVWEREEETFIFKITTQIIESLHILGMIPYAWNALRMSKDIISPQQSVLLRLVNFMFRGKYLTPSVTPPTDHDIDDKLLHYLFNCVRSRIVPECLAFLKLQAEIRRGNADPTDFPVDTWDMERAKEGLAQVLEFLATASEIDGMRKLLIDWNATFELIALLKGLEDGVAKLNIVNSSRPDQQPAAHLAAQQTYSSDSGPPPPPPPPPVSDQEPAYKFPWAGIKLQVLEILANLLQPVDGKARPGNPIVQTQIMEEQGIVPLLSCCVYDDHNRFAREHVQLCLKFLTDGSTEAKSFIENLVRSAPAPPAPPAPRAPAATVERTLAALTAFVAPTAITAPSTSEPVRLRINGIEGEVRVAMRQPHAAPGPGIADGSVFADGFPATAAALARISHVVDAPLERLSLPLLQDPSQRPNFDPPQGLYLDFVSNALEASRRAAHVITGDDSEDGAIM